MEVWAALLVQRELTLSMVLYFLTKKRQSCPFHSDCENKEEQSHWKEMLSPSPNKSNARWHHLKPAVLPETSDILPPPFRRKSIGVAQMEKLQGDSSAKSDGRRSVTWRRNRGCCSLVSRPCRRSVFNTTSHETISPIDLPRNAGQRELELIDKLQFFIIAACGLWLVSCFSLQGRPLLADVDARHSRQSLFPVFRFVLALGWGMRLLAGFPNELLPVYDRPRTAYRRIRSRTIYINSKCCDMNMAWLHNWLWFAVNSR